MTRKRALLLALLVVAFVLMACIGDLDIDRSGFQATATASVKTEMTRRAITHKGD